MTDLPKEVTEIHTRLSKCSLEIENSRAFWAHADEADTASSRRAFDEYWFGARSLPRIQVLLANMRARFSAYPSALTVLSRWPEMSPETRQVICHWHVQLSDPLYRLFTGVHLPERRSGLRPEVTLDQVTDWVGEQRAERWTMPMRIQFASKLLSTAYAADLIGSNRDPRPVTLPRVPGEALEYLLYLLRETEFEGTLLDNPYTNSVGLDSGALEERLRGLPGLSFRRQGTLVDFGWRYPDLLAWADANLPDTDRPDGDLPDGAQRLAGAAR